MRASFKTGAGWKDWEDVFRPSWSGALRGVVGILIALYAIQLIWSVGASSAMDWPTVREYLFASTVLEGLARTLLLTALTMIIGIVLGTLLAVWLRSSSAILSAASRLYVWFFRGTPLLVQLILWYNLAALFPVLSIGLPFMEPIVSAKTNDVVSPWVAAILGLALHEAAYMAEIIRAGINSVDRGQWDAARAVGFTAGQTLRRIVLPQALYVIIPPTGNQVISTLKMTSLVSVIAVVDLLYSVQIIYSRNLQTIPLLLVATVWYLACVSVLTVVQRHIELRLGKSVVLGGG